MKILAIAFVAVAVCVAATAAYDSQVAMFVVAG